MATALTIPLMPVEEYLDSSFEYDMEYVDGVLVERSMPTGPHSLLQVLLGVWFFPLRLKYLFAVLSEQRVEIVQRSRYRVPDVLLCELPAPRGVLTQAPLAVIEILSPRDSLSNQIARYREYWTRGVRQIIILDPEDCRAFRYSDGALTEGAIDGIQLPSGSVVPFSTAELFQQLRAELARTSTGESESDSESSSR